MSLLLFFTGAKEPFRPPVEDHTHGGGRYYRYSKKEFTWTWEPEEIRRKIIKEDEDLLELIMICVESDILN